VYTDYARAIMLAVMMASAAGCSQTSKRHDADAELKAIYTAEWTWREAQFPDDEDSQKPIADHLPDVGPAAQEARLKYWLDVERRRFGPTSATRRDGRSEGCRTTETGYRRCMTSLAISASRRMKCAPA
jgi:hypothetical protein